MIGVKLSTLQTPRLVTVISAGRIRRASGSPLRSRATPWRISAEICSTVLAAGEATGITNNSPSWSIATPMASVPAGVNRSPSKRQRKRSNLPMASATARHEERIPGDLHGRGGLAAAAMADASTLV